MKRFTFFLVLCLAIAITGCDKGEDTEGGDAIVTQTDSVSYAIGFNIGRDFHNQGIDINLAVFSNAIRDGLADTTPRLDENTARQVLMNYQRVLQQKQEEKRQKEAAENIQKSNQFMAENKGKPGVTEIPSGVQYSVIKEGTGKTPTIDDTVTFHYHGTLMDGSVFESSREKGQPVTYPVKGLIQAWQQILPMMKEGATYKLWAPPALAYGEYGQPPKIGPNVALAFEIDLLSVGAPAAPAGSPQR